MCGGKGVVYTIYVSQSAREWFIFQSGYMGERERWLILYGSPEFDYNIFLGTATCTRALYSVKYGHKHDATSPS